MAWPKAHRESGSAVVVVLLIIIILFIYLTASIQCLHLLGRELHAVEANQIRRLATQVSSGTTNSLSPPGNTQEAINSAPAPFDPAPAQTNRVGAVVSGIPN